MRSRSKNGSLSLAVLLVLTCCCGKNDDRRAPDHEVPLQGASQAESFANSGKRLSGEFVFQVVKDLYASGEARESDARIFTFDEDGNFKVERFAGPAATVEEGSYLIDKEGGLVLYFDKAGGALLESARRERYNIISQTELVLRLEQPPATEFVLRKR